MAIARVLIAILFLICLFLFQPISWALSLLFVLLALGSCMSDLPVWAPLGCFAALLGLHAFIMNYPLDELERRWGIEKPTRRKPLRRRVRS